MALDPSKDPNKNLLIALKHGSRLRILVSKPTTKQSVAPPAQNKSMLRGLEYEDVIIPKLGQPWWDFYDLGTRLRTVTTPSTFLNGYRALEDMSAVNPDPSRYLEYVEFLFTQGASLDAIQGVGVPEGESDVYRLQHDHMQIDPSDASEFFIWDDRMIDPADLTDPFGTTTLEYEGARAIPNCLPIKYHGIREGGFSNPRQADVFEVETYTTDPEVTEVYPNVKQSLTYANRAYAEGRFSEFVTLGPDWKSADEATPERLPDELWNPLSLMQYLDYEGEDYDDEVDIEARGRLDRKDKESEGVQIRVISPNTYETFDTGDTTLYKVTNEPFFSADEVPFVATGKTPLKFYLKPRYFGFCRAIGFSWQFSWQYETYRMPYGDGTYWNAWSGCSMDDSVGGSGPGYYSVSVQRMLGVRDNPTSDGTASLTLDHMTGDFTVSGVPGGAITGNAAISISGHRFGYADNGSCEVYVFAAASATPLTSSNSAPFTVVWHSEGLPFFGTPDEHTFGAGLSEGWIKGGHIGRLPVFPRMAWTSSWSGFNVPSPNPRVYSDGSSKLYVAGDAANFIGQIQTVSDYERELAHSYARHPDRDSESFLLTHGGIGGTYAIPPATGSLSEEDLTIPPAFINVGAGSEYGTFQDHIDSVMAPMLSALSGPHFRNVIIFGDDPGDYDTFYGDIYAVPMSLPVGALCGVITKGATKYYIWNKVAADRRTYDYNRRAVRLDIDSEFSQELE